jgi:hypothetical protein
MLQPWYFSFLIQLWKQKFLKDWDSESNEGAGWDEGKDKVRYILSCDITHYNAEWRYLSEVQF